MSRLVSRVFALVVIVSASATAAPPSNVNLSRAIPNDAYLAVYAKHNPERDYQKKYYREVWETVEETQIIDKALKIITSKIPEEELNQASSVLKQLQEAVEPIDLQAILGAKESVYAQIMQFPQTHHLMLMRLTPDAAASCETAVKNLFNLAAESAGDEIQSLTTDVEGVQLVSLAFPEKVPFRPTIARVNDVIILSSTEQMAKQSLTMLAGKGGPSKFEDPRVKEALSQLPQPEDSVVFYDGKLQFEQLGGVSEFIRQQAKGEPEAERWIALLDKFMDEMAVLDYEATVEYTENNRNCSAALGKLRDDAESKLPSKVFGSAQPFEQWNRWVPAGALSYSLSSGANLHPVYEWIVNLVQQDIPEAQEHLEKFEAIQAQLGVHLDRDILQAFSGECVSISMPADDASPLAGPQSVMAMRCQKPDRISELLNRCIEAVGDHPALAAQQVKFAKSTELEGFDEISATFLAMFGAKPVIGHRDGWMLIGSSAGAVQNVLDARAGDETTVIDTDQFRQFQLDIDGPVSSTSYSNLAESTRNTAKALNQVGMFVPMIIGMAGAQADPEDLKPIQDLMGLLPSVAKIVSKFDFYEAKLAVTQEGDKPNTYMRRGVVLVRPESATN